MIAPNGAARITLVFTQLDTEAGWDRVRVYQCSDIDCGSAQLLSELSGSYSSNQDVTSNSGFMAIWFASDESVTRSGFMASWSSTVTASEVRTLPLPHL
jgi:hypothetical protein